MSIRSVENLVKKWANKTDERLMKKGIKSNLKDRLKPHSLRHSFTIHLLNKAKRPLNEVQQLLGHDNIATTQIYTQVDNKNIKKWIQKNNMAGFLSIK